MEKALTKLQGTEGYFEDILLNVALGYFHLGQTDNLIEFTGKCLKMFPLDPKLRFLRSAGYLSQERYGDAINDLETLLQLKEIAVPTVFSNYLSVSIREIRTCLAVREKGYECSPVPPNQQLKLISEDLIIFLTAAISGRIPFYAAL